MTILEDKKLFAQNKSNIQQALNGSTGLIDGVKGSNKEDIFYMLLFCLCVPQSKAVLADQCIKELRSKDFMEKGMSLESMCSLLRGRVRFHNTKAQRLLDARKQFLTTAFFDAIKKFYNDSLRDKSLETLKECRRWLCENVNGMGMKLSAHFMRNVGMRGLCILDVHIVTGLQERGIFPITFGKLNLADKSLYELLEEKMMAYAKRLDISSDELDFMLWSDRTGYVFK